VSLSWRRQSREAAMRCSGDETVESDEPMRDEDAKEFDVHPTGGRCGSQIYVCVKSLRRLATAIALPFIRCLFPLGTWVRGHPPVDTSHAQSC
jgi:hypothetical protein